METVNWSKLDRGLRSLYRESVDGSVSPDDSPAARLTVILEHTGQLKRTTLSNIGFTVTGEMSGTCFQGELSLASLPQLTQREEVTLISFGTENRIVLEQSLSSTQTRASSPALTDGVWHFSDVANTFSGNTGAGVVIGIIDTGIDINHPCFQNTGGTGTRIHAIWDHFLTPQTAESSPAATLLTPGSSASYGVEYLKTEIDSSPANVRHEDENGHGTHVAGIAAGNGAANTGTPNSRSANIGIAPEARIIVVKLLNPCSRNQSNIGFNIRLRDAYHYVINKAAELFSADTPVVFNCSFTKEVQPHDGRDWSGNEYPERHIHEIFNGAVGKICVVGAANSAGKDSHLKIILPDPGGTVDLPFTILDTRARCINSTDMDIEVLYPDDTIGDVRGWVKLPDLVQFFGGEGTGVTTGTAPGESYAGVYGAARHLVYMEHLTLTAQSPYGDVTRRNLSLKLKPRRRRHHSGNFVFRIGGPPGTILHLWVGTKKDHRVVFDRAALLSTAGVEIENKSTIGSPAQSPDVITVGAYDINSGGTPFVAPFSSRGPLVAYDGSPVIADKPDVTAPGVKVNSANKNALARAVSPSGHYIPKSGTSMAAPHIAGLVALMLNKNRTLTRPQIMAALSSSLTPPLLVPDLHHDPTPDYDTASYAVPTINPPQAGQDETGIGRLLYKNVLDQITAIP